MHTCTENVLSACLSLMASTTLRLWRLLPNLDDFMRTHFFLVYTHVKRCCIYWRVNVCNMNAFFVLLICCFFCVSLHYVIMISHPTIHTHTHVRMKQYTPIADDFGISMVALAMRSWSCILRRWVERKTTTIRPKLRRQTHTDTRTHLFGTHFFFF